MNGIVGTYYCDEDKFHRQGLRSRCLLGFHTRCRVRISAEGKERKPSKRRSKRPREAPPFLKKEVVGRHAKQSK